jgi:enolase
MKIVGVSAYQIFDSRGVPTLEAEVLLEDGTRGRGLVPAGASTGQFEAVELRDGDATRWRGKSVLRAVENVRREVAPALIGRDPRDQAGIDRRLVELDGTANKSRLGANAILGVSMAVADAAAKAVGVPLFEYLGDGKGVLLPLPEIQMIGGGAHANWRTDVQDFLLIAIGACSYDESLEISHNVYHAAGELLKRRGTYFGVADEGGYWPEFDSHEAVFQLLMRSIEAAGYTPGRQAALALDLAASDFYEPATGRYRLRLENRTLATEQMVALVCDWCRSYPIVSLEDPLADTDWEGWRQLHAALGERVQLVGDDLFTTNPARIRQGIANGLANAVLIKLNQIGTVSETLEAIRLTQQAGWRPIISARSGETEDVLVAHLAVATNAGQLKVGSFSRSERMAKWNEVLRISRRLGERACFVAADASGAIALPPQFPPVSGTHH